jgi:hypothetical protein
MHWLAEHGKDIKRESQSFKPVCPQYTGQRSGLVLPSIVVRAMRPARPGQQSENHFTKAQEIKILK